MGDQNVGTRARRVPGIESPSRHLPVEWIETTKRRSAGEQEACHGQVRDSKGERRAMGVSEVTNSVRSIGLYEMPAAVLRSDRTPSP